MRKDAPHTAERKAARAVAEGRVQGVGFRYWTVQVAREFGITGWVRNCPAVQHSHPRAYISNFTVTAAQYRGLESFDVLF